jgi:hypothetical protein
MALSAIEGEVEVQGRRRFGLRSCRSHRRDFGMNSERPAWVTREWLRRAALAASSEAQGMTSSALGQAGTPHLTLPG